MEDSEDQAMESVLYSLCNGQPSNHERRSTFLQDFQLECYIILNLCNSTVLYWENVCIYAGVHCHGKRFPPSSHSEDKKDKEWVRASVLILDRI